MRFRIRGFTLIELLVVIAIISLLLAILLPALSRSRELGQRSKCSVNVRSIAQAMFNYAINNNDQVPLNQGSEPDYVYVRGSSTILAPGNEWHLGELLMPEMNMQPPLRNAQGKFDNSALENLESEGKIFYCPSTKNAFASSAEFPTWSTPSAFGSFMDYAQFWNYTGPAAIRQGNDLLAISPEGVFRVLDDNQNVIGGNPSNPGALYDLPFVISQTKHLSMPHSSAEVPVIGEYMTSFNRNAAGIQSDFQAANLRPEGGNHKWTGHTGGSGIPVEGGNFGYIDGHVEWRTSKQVRPRLLIDRNFSGGSNRPVYWW